MCIKYYFHAVSPEHLYLACVLQRQTSLSTAPGRNQVPLIVIKLTTVKYGRRQKASQHIIRYFSDCGDLYVSGNEEEIIA
jgi:hypothetical protein